MSCVLHQLPRCVNLDASQPLPPLLHSGPSNGLPKALCWRLVARLVALFACTAVTTPAVDNVRHRANRVSQRQMGNRWPYQL